MLQIGSKRLKVQHKRTGGYSPLGMGDLLDDADPSYLADDTYQEENEASLGLI